MDSVCGWEIISIQTMREGGRRVSAIDNRPLPLLDHLARVVEYANCISAEG